MSTREQISPDRGESMKDRIALVTGGSRGIGSATAFLLGRYGARVAVNYYRNEAAAQRVVSTIEKAGGRALAVQAVLTPFTASKWEALESFVRGQLQAAFYPSQAVLPNMMHQHRGSIVFVSSTTVRRPVPGGGGMAIAIGKASVESMIKNMAAVAYLASNQAAFVTGAYLTVDGGNLIM
jgi:3-oxoacyl-[acyl-carrier protein] reductase